MLQLSHLPRLVAAAAIAAATAIGLTAPPPAAAAPCVMRVISEISRGPFSGGSLLSWRLANTCAGVTLSVTVDGRPVAASGTVVVDPLVTTSYVVDAFRGSERVSRSISTALGGDVVGYRASTSTTGQVSLTPELNPSTRAATAARTIGGDVVEGLGEMSRRALVGKTVEIHLIPAAYALTDAAPWAGYRTKMTCEAIVDGKPNRACVDPRPWSEVRGMGGSLIPGSTSRVATPVGEEEVVAVAGHPSTHALGHILAHELGHTVLDFAAANRLTAVQSALTTATSDSGHDYLGDDAYTKSTPHEYFAEGTAAYFGYEYGSQFAGEFTRSWLATHEPDLYAVLSRVYTEG